ncbi:hypothetical protein K2173_014017 [Erythroxylum novogranatense]|uniref:4-coumarate--CoA ligase n=1 Tax=Erythroxylum novogranatense TaxID=1862640 RepID=A0AAV8SD28_9ROSI|nr:hypothetical protein K2173_014017 [Erythroxylum novogranatense]
MTQQSAPSSTLRLHDTASPMTHRDASTILVDPRSGFNSVTSIFHSLRPPLQLPPVNIPITAADYSLSLLATSPWSLDHTSALINSATGRRVSYSEFTGATVSLASYLQRVVGLTKNDTAFVLCSNSIEVPILYFSLLYLGVVVSPGNPVSTVSEIARQVELCKPVIAFATSSTAHKLPKLKRKTILLDSPEFDTIITTKTDQTRDFLRVDVSQTDVAAILYSSGTTGKVKGVMLTHRNLIAEVSAFYTLKRERKSPAVIFYTVPYFHVYGFFYSFKSVALSETVVVMEKFELKKMLTAMEEFRVTHVAVAPPVVVSMTKSGLTDEYDLRSLERVGSGGAPLGKDVIASFKSRFPSVQLWQGYGLTESCGGVFRQAAAEECVRSGSVGRLCGGCEAKIVDPETGNALPPGKHGELWIRGPIVMKGYVGDPEATSATLVSDGWLRTGDLCYIDEEGFLFVVDRLKELIKYKGYQVPPAELEQLLQSHPEIADAAVIPFPDDEAGQIPMAFVVKQPHSNLNEQEVVNYVAQQVAPYKKVRRVVFINSIPKSSAGKILRKDLRSMVLPGSRM